MALDEQAIEKEIHEKGLNAPRLTPAHIDAQILAECEPVYVEFDGWRTPTDKARKFGDLPLKARLYLKAISELSNAKLFIASVGPGRDQTIFV